MPEPSLPEAVDLTRTGDGWVLRGGSVADRAIRTLTEAPVDHVGMAVVREDLPPLLRHAELGRSLPDGWTGQHQRGVRLHDLADAVGTRRRLLQGATPGPEIPVDVPAPQPSRRTR